MALVRSLVRSLVRPLPRSLMGLEGNPLEAYAVNSLTPETIADFGAVKSASPLYAYTGLVKTFKQMFDYTGASNKVQVDSTGFAKWAPHNLLTNSENAAGWSSVGLTVSGDTATEDTSTGQHALFQASIATPRATLVADVAVSGRDWVRAALSLGTGRAVYFNAATLSVGSAATGLSDASIQDVGGGVVRIKVTGEGVTASGSGVQIGPSTGDGVASYEGDGASTFRLVRAYIYRSDLAGMASVPLDERGLASDDTYVPTTTAARYLPRTDSYRYNGTSFVRKGLRLESEQRTNSCLHSRAFDNAAWAKVDAPTVTANAVGVDGAANSAYTVTDDSGSNFEFIRQIVTVPNDSNPSALTAFVGKTVGASSFPGMQAVLSGGTGFNVGITINTDNGTLTNRTSLGPTASYIEDWSPLFWRVTLIVTNNGLGNTSLACNLVPAVNTDASGTWSASTTGSAVFDQCDVNIGASTPSSPIITGASAVTRAAETLTIAAAKMAANTTGMSFQIQGELDYADNGANPEARFFNWESDVNNVVRIDLRTDSTRTGSVQAQQRESANISNSRIDSPEYSPGLNVPFNVASRNTSGAINAAKDGAASTEDTSPVALADLSAADFDLGQDFNGHIALFRQWGVDIADAGIEEATA